jgi:hypothetical protein
MADWSHIYDSFGDTDRVPELLQRVEHEDDAEAWDELWYRLVLECDVVSPAGFVALPHLIRCADWNPRACRLAGMIMRRAAGGHGCDDLLVSCSGAIAEFRVLLDQHLLSRPADYLDSLLDLLAVRGEYHWSAVLGDFSDDFYMLDCPHCGEEVTIAIGGHGRYAAIRDWDRGDVERRGLRPASPQRLAGTGRWMHETVRRDGRRELADGITHLFGWAECPRCASVFNIADEYTAANRPVL